MAILRYLCFLCNVLWNICCHYNNLIFEVSITSKSKEVAFTIITLPEEKHFIFFHVFHFPFENGYRFKTLFFDHNVRYGSSVTFRIGVASQSLQNLDNHEPQRFDFCIDASQLNKLVNYIINNCKQ